MASRERAFTDADFKVVAGAYRFGEQHRTHRGWYFIGRYDDEGWPLFIRKPWPAWLTFLVWLACAAAALSLIALGSVAWDRSHGHPPIAARLPSPAGQAAPRP